LGDGNIKIRGMTREDISWGPKMRYRYGNDWVKAEIFKFITLEVDKGEKEE
jgi:hypothetical protein